MMPYPTSRGDADRAAKLQEESVLGVIGVAKDRVVPGDDGPVPVARPGADACDGGGMPPVWKRYIDSRLKQFCTR